MQLTGSMYTTSFNDERTLEIMNTKALDAALLESKAAPTMVPPL